MQNEVKNTNSRAPVKYSSGILKISLKQLGTGQNVEVVDHSTSTQIKEILTKSTITSASPLPPPNMSQGMLDGHSFAQLSPSLRSLLALVQLDEQSFIRMDADTTSFGTGGALALQGTLGTGFCRKVNDAARNKWTTPAKPSPGLRLSVVVDPNHDPTLLSGWCRTPVRLLLLLPLRLVLSPAGRLPHASPF